MASEQWLRQYIHAHLTRSLVGLVKVPFDEGGVSLIAELTEAALEGWPRYVASHEMDVDKIREIITRHQ